MTFNTELWNTQTPGAGGYEIERSLRFNSADSAYLSRTPSSAGNRRTFTLACWVKRTNIGGSHSIIFDAKSSSATTPLGFNATTADKLEFYEYDGSLQWELRTTQLFRDPGAWMHLVAAVDTTQATSSDRVKLYINGSQITDFSTEVYPAQNRQLDWNATAIHTLGVKASVANSWFDGYLADVHFIDGQALDPTSFGEFDATTGVWNPIAYTGSYGTNGFHLDFADNSAATATTLGKDTSGNSNNWTPNNLSVTAGAGNDSLVDSPTNYGTDTGAGGEVRGNCATLLDQWVTDKTRLTMANGNLDVTFNNAGSSSSALSSIGVSSGKWYCELTCTQTGNYYAFVGISSIKITNVESLGYDDTYAYVSNTGNKVSNGTGVSYGATWTANDVLGIALNLDSGTLTFYKNGVSQGQAYTGISGTYNIGCTGFQGWKFTANFGQRAFAYTAPSGYKALCTANLDDPTIADGSNYFDTKLYTGNGSTQTISGLGFSPDLVWLKGRSQADRHYWFDTVRGKNALLASNETTSETDYSSTYPNYLQSFDTTGFTLGYYAAQGGLNKSGETYAAWTWDGGSSNTSISTGDSNSSFYNQDQVWSNFLSRNTVSGGGNLGSVTDAFNGTIWSMSDAANCGYSNDYTGSSITFAPTSGTLVGQVVKLYQRIRPSTVTVNGTAATITTSGDTRICTVDLGSPQNITSVVTTATTIGQTNAFSYIEVDGKLLVDSGVSLAGLTQYPSIASTVRANPSAGFSIVTYTGNGSTSQTIGHGLGVSPSMVLIKNRDANEDWVMWFTGLSVNEYFYLDSAAKRTYAGSWGSLPTSSVFSNFVTHGNTNNYVAYCFAPVEGYSAFGSYTGNGSTNGPFVYTGFRPRWILVKNTSIAGSNWRIVDTARNTYNEANLLLNPNSSNSEQTTTANQFDILSNGFKLRGSDNDTNGSGETLIYMALAENPFKYARAR